VSRRCEDGVCVGGCGCQVGVWPAGCGLRAAGCGIEIRMVDGYILVCAWAGGGWKGGVWDECWSLGARGEGQKLEGGTIDSMEHMVATVVLVGMVIGKARHESCWVLGSSDFESCKR